MQERDREKWRKKKRKREEEMLDTDERKQESPVRGQARVTSCVRSIFCT